MLVLTLAGAIGTLRVIDHLRQGAVFQEVLYIRSPKMLKRISLGYSGLLADIYWTRAVQYFGYQHYKRSSDFHLLAPLLEITTQLDPKLLPAYEFGSNFLSPYPPNGAGQPDQAIALVEYGIQNNPDNWKLYYELGFIYYTELKDYAGAEKAFERGSKAPNAHQVMAILAARMAQHAGEYETARILWLTTYQNTKDPQIRENAVDHLRALQVDEDVTQLEEAVAKYREQTGQLPASMGALERAGLIRGTPVDPTGRPYKLMSDGRIEVQDPDRILFITQGLPPGMESPQVKVAKKP